MIVRVPSIHGGVAHVCENIVGVCHEPLFDHCIEYWLLEQHALHFYLYADNNLSTAYTTIVKPRAVMHSLNFGS